jgi:hypothetical protein
MPVHSSWDDLNRTVIRTTHSAEWTWDELHQHDTQVVVPMLESVHHNVALIVDMRRSAWVPLSGFSEEVKQAADTHRLHNIDLVIFVLLKSAHRRYGRSTKVYLAAQTLEEARAAISAYRSGNGA